MSENFYDGCVDNVSHVGPYFCIHFDKLLLGTIPNDSHNNYDRNEQLPDLEW